MSTLEKEFKKVQDQIHKIQEKFAENPEMNAGRYDQLCEKLWRLEDLAAEIEREMKEEEQAPNPEE